MMDKIKIENLEVFAKHGVFPEENVLGQKFLISAELYTDTRAAGLTDDLTASIHYGEVCQFIDRFMKEHTYQLIERVAEALAQQLLLDLKHLQKVKLEVKKPWAPVGLPLASVSVEIERSWHRVYIALGSNMGDSKGHLDAAVKAIGQAEDCRVEKVSSYIQTEAYGVTDQDDFLNACMEIRTLKTPEELLVMLHEIEAGRNRERIIRWGPRTLDLDIIFYDDLVSCTEELCIPHIDMQNRQFVLEPMMEIAPYRIHPLLKKSIRQLKAELYLNTFPSRRQLPTL